MGFLIVFLGIISFYGLSIGGTFLKHSSAADSRQDKILTFSFLGSGILALALIIFIFANMHKQNQKHTDYLSNTRIVTENSNSYTSVFSNAYGTATTMCAHSGCINYIASSGDTNCCTKHSNKCLNCGKYIDEDARYCMDCLNSSIEKSNNLHNSESVTSGGCQYKYSNGSLCGKKTNKYNNLCDEHFEELNEIYNSLTGY